MAVAMERLYVNGEQDGQAGCSFFYGMLRAPSTGILLLRLPCGIKVDPGIGVAVTLRRGHELWQAISLRTRQHPAIVGTKTGLEQR